jgi:hypothetical protein
MDILKEQPIVVIAILLAALWLYARSSFVQNPTTKLFAFLSPRAEGFSTCYQSKQFHLNSVNPDEMTSIADVNLEKQFGKLFINIQANLPYAQGGDFHTVWGAYHAFLVDSKHKKSINLGSLAYSGDHWYRLRTELLGDYSNYDTVQVWRQTEDYKPKLLLSGSISAQTCSSL